MSDSLTRTLEKSDAVLSACLSGDEFLGSWMLSEVWQLLLWVLLLRLHSSESWKVPFPWSPFHSLLDDFFSNFKDLVEAVQSKNADLFFSAKKFGYTFYPNIPLTIMVDIVIQVRCVSTLIPTVCSSCHSFHYTYPRVLCFPSCVIYIKSSKKV